jgi:hypothetical protein
MGLVLDILGQGSAQFFAFSLSASSRQVSVLIHLSPVDCKAAHRKTPHYHNVSHRATRTTTNKTKVALFLSPAAWTGIYLEAVTQRKAGVHTVAGLREGWRVQEHGQSTSSLLIKGQEHRLE